jgi:hypothetical protein
MSYFAFSGQTRPNRLERVKDETYHADFGKFCCATMGNYLYRRYISKCLINWSFFKGGDGQWIFEEDTEAFFLDESGDVRNRVKWTKNVLKPMVQQYVGNAIRLSYDAKASCISDFVINKREAELRKILTLHRLSQTDDTIGKLIRENNPIGDTELETEEIFINSFTETHEKDINNLIEYISQDVDINEIKVQLARNLALTGLGIYKGYEAGGLYKAEAVNPMFFFWDMSARKPDLSDSEYQGEWYYMDAPTIMERYPNINDAQRRAIEGYNRTNNMGVHRFINGIFTQAGGKIPVYEIYWKDVEKREYGYVKDEFGYPFYTMINHADSNYKDKDLITPPVEKHKDEMGDKRKHTIFVDVMRYVVLIPQTELGINTGDIVLEYGIAPYQEKNLYDPANVKFPYKIYSWVYDRGEVLTPLDDAIDPQRFLNRTLSVVESHMANMRGTGTVISKSAIDDRDGEADMRRNINASKPIVVDTDRVGSVQNAVGTYGTNIGGGTLQMFEVINQVQMSIQDVTGVNESMTGTQGTSDALVGVVEAQIQRGSLVQEPFYWALTSILKQAYEHMATVGKAIYIDNPRRLAMMVGDSGMKDITLTEDHLLQDYRIFINRGETREQGIAAGNQLLFTLLQSGLIDDIRFSNLFNRSNAEQIADAIREFAKEKKMAQNEMDKAQAQRNQQEAQQTQMMAEGLQQEEANRATAEGVNKEMEHEREMERIAMKENAKTERDILKSNGMQ